MPIKFDCPACTAPMVYDGESTLFQNCNACGAPIVVPAEVVNAVLQQQSESDSRDLPADPVYKNQSTNESKLLASERIEEELRAGNRVQAIKLHSETFQTDIETSKAAINLLEQELHNQDAAEVIIRTQKNEKEFAEHEQNLRINEVAMREARNDSNIDLSEEDSPEIEERDPEKYMSDVVRTLRSGRKIEAIKLFRELFNTSLLTAKETVEAIERGEDVDPMDFS